MSEEPFYGKARLKELRVLFRNHADLSHAGEEGLALVTYLHDLTSSLSRSSQDEEEAFHFVIRTMGLIASAYAQEAYTARGFRNPFKEGSQTGKGPKRRVWVWPVIIRYQSTGGAFNTEFNAFSALKMFGYTVGKTNGWPEPKRREFLSDFMELDLPDIIERTFGDAYGKPMSTTRLRKMANVIASNAENFFRNDPRRYSVAIAEWDSDLAFLKAKYYEGAGLKFQPWPEVKGAA